MEKEGPESQKYLQNEFVTLREAEKNESTVTVGVYNILADCNAIHKYFPYVKEEYFTFEYRAPRIVEQMKQLNADIYILSELDRFVEYYKPSLSKIGYKLIFESKKRGDKTEGTGIAYKADKFEIIEEYRVNYDKEFELKDFRTQKKGCVGLILVLKSVALNTHLLIGGTHLFWNPEISHLQFTQICCFLSKIRELEDKYKELDLITILGGDLNSFPDSNVIRRIKGDKLGYEEHPTVREGIYQALNIYGDEGNNMISAYQFYNGKEEGVNNHPRYTTYTETFHGCIDFIFYKTTPKLSMETIKMLKVPDEDVVTMAIGLPNLYLPSDHLLIATKFALKLE